MQFFENILARGRYFCKARGDTVAMAECVYAGLVRQRANMSRNCQNKMPLRTGMCSDSQCNVTKLSQNAPLHSKLSCSGVFFRVFFKKHLTNMQFRAAILLSALSKMALVVRSVSRRKNYKEDYL